MCTKHNPYSSASITTLLPSEHYFFHNTASVTTLLLLSQHYFFCHRTTSITTLLLLSQHYFLCHNTASVTTLLHICCETHHYSRDEDSAVAVATLAILHCTEISSPFPPSLPSSLSSPPSSPLLSSLPPSLPLSLPSSLSSPPSLSENATSQLEDQGSNSRQQHVELMEDLGQLRSKARQVWDKIGEGEGVTGCSHGNHGQSSLQHVSQTRVWRPCLPSRSRRVPSTTRHWRTSGRSTPQSTTSSRSPTAWTTHSTTSWPG